MLKGSIQLVKSCLWRTAERVKLRTLLCLVRAMVCSKCGDPGHNIAKCLKLQESPDDSGKRGSEILLGPVRRRRNSRKSGTYLKDFHRTRCCPRFQDRVRNPCHFIHDGCDARPTGTTTRSARGVCCPRDNKTLAAQSDRGSGHR